MNDLEALTTARDFLLKQNSKAMNCKSHCVYKSSNGKKCGVGCLIPDELYSVSFESESVNCVVDSSPALQELFKDLELETLEAIQAIHDNSSVEDWEDKFNILIKQEKLNDNT